MDNNPYQHLAEPKKEEYVLHTIVLKPADLDMKHPRSGGFSKFTKWVCARYSPMPLELENVMSSNNYNELLDEIDNIFDKRSVSSPWCMNLCEKIMLTISLALFGFGVRCSIDQLYWPLLFTLLLIPVLYWIYHFGRGKKSNQKKMLQALISKWNNKNLMATFVESSGNGWVDHGNETSRPMVLASKKISLKCDDHFWDGMYFPKKTSLTYLIVAVVRKTTTYIYPNPKLYITVSCDSAHITRDASMV